MVTSRYTFCVSCPALHLPTLFSQVKAVLFEPVRKTQEARYFRIIRGKDGKELYEACSPAYPGPKIETTLEDLAKNGKASQVRGSL